MFGNGRCDSLRGTLSPLDTEKVPKKLFRITPSRSHSERGSGHGVPRQWYQSPAELDFDKELQLPRARGRHETCLVRLGTYGSLAPPFGEGGAESGLVGDWL